MHFLLQNKRDRLAELFELGYIDKFAYLEIDKELELNIKLFTICLN